MTITADPPPAAQAAGTPKRPRKKALRTTSLFAHGEPMVWLTGGSLVLAVFMIAGLLGLVLWQGGSTFWPGAILHVELADGSAYLGEVASKSSFAPEESRLEALSDEVAERARTELEANGGLVDRFQLRTENFELTNVHYRWIEDYHVLDRSLPEWALLVERNTWGRFYGTPVAFRLDGATIATEPDEVWSRFQEHHDKARARYHARQSLETHEIGAVNRTLEDARLHMRAAELAEGRDSERWRRAEAAYRAAEEEANGAFTRIRREIDALNTENGRYELVLETSDGVEKALALDEVVRIFPANQLGFGGKLSVYLSRWWEFLTADPREANAEGGVFPAIFGTIAMTLLMSLVVVPFGVLAALYLREYAKQGTIVSIVRIAVNNLAGVPSIVFGVFGLGFFCYVIGSSIDEVFFSAKLPNPTFGKGGVLWAALTLALLTLPVVIVATEEALSAVPNSMREGSYACGATKWQTIRRIVLPRAAPGIMTGMILAIARGAGEVAPLMLVGAVKLAPELPVDGVVPFLHPERSFMHLGFHIFDLGFQSQNSEAAKPMVYTTTLLLIAIVVLLNLVAVWIRGRLRRRFQSVHI